MRALRLAPVAACLVAAFLALMPAAFAQTVKLDPKEGDYVARNFKFRSGETLPELRLHYTTLGTPHRNARGEIDNAVLIMHGTGGDGKQFFRPQFADVLFAQACARNFRNTTMTTWSPPTTSC
jgi:homoserine O-acetyltransferase